MCWWANMRVRRETWPSTCLQLNRLQIKCSILRCCACTWRMTSERGSQWLGLLFARMQMRLQVRRTWRGAQIHQFTFQWQIWRRKTRKQWDWHATNQSRIPRCSSWTPTPITTSEKIFGVLCIRRRQSTSICSPWHPHMAVWKTTVLCLELLSTSHRPAECCRGWCLISNIMKFILIRPSMLRWNVQCATQSLLQKQTRSNSTVSHQNEAMFHNFMDHWFPSSFRIRSTKQSWALPAMSFLCYSEVAVGVSQQILSHQGFAAGADFLRGYNLGLCCTGKVLYVIVDQWCRSSRGGNDGYWQKSCQIALLFHAEMWL